MDYRNVDSWVWWGLHSSYGWHLFKPKGREWKQSVCVDADSIREAKVGLADILKNMSDASLNASTSI